MPLSKKRMRKRKELDRCQTQTGLTRGEVLLKKIVKSAKKRDCTGLTLPPLYNPSVHRPGDTVRMYKGNVTATIPELDADGNVIY